MDSPQSVTPREQGRIITQFIREEGERLRKKYSWLKHQNAIGLTIFISSTTIMILSAYACWLGYLHPVALVITNGIAASLLHELEHDMIHGLYFKDTWVERLMMYGVWIFRGNTPNPYYRKKIHLLHHKDSGQVTDIEEQMIGNGMKFGIARLLTMFDQNLSFLINARRVAKTAPELNPKEMALASFPGMWLYYGALYAFAAIEILLLIGSSLPYLTAIQPYTRLLFWAYVLPNFIRQGSIQLISSNMHYFGDIAPGKDGLVQQTQILRPWWLWPFQLFCFNFGTTHGIHHFVVNQPFYLRQMVAFRAIPFMREHGVRYNDIGSFWRANRYRATAAI